MDVSLQNRLILFGRRKRGLPISILLWTGEVKIPVLLQYISETLQ